MIAAGTGGYGAAQMDRVIIPVEQLKIGEHGHTHGCIPSKVTKIPTTCKMEALNKCKGMVNNARVNGWIDLSDTGSGFRDEKVFQRRIGLQKRVEYLKLSTLLLLAW